MTSAGQTRQHKKKFLAHFAEYGNVTIAARSAGVARSSVYLWQELDEAFAAAFREAEIQATEVLEGEARRRAVEGVTTETPIYAHGQLIDTAVETKYSDTLLIFLLKARAPERYRDRYDVTSGGQSLTTVHEDLDAAIERRLAAMVTGSQGSPPLAIAGPSEATHP